MEKRQRTCHLYVEDQGEGFDPGIVSDPTSPENIDKPSGRGIFLMRNLAIKSSSQKEADEYTIAWHLS
jgi:serine/threonine-protein kinase RsbW